LRRNLGCEDVRIMNDLYKIRCSRCGFCDFPSVMKSVKGFNQVVCEDLEGCTQRKKEREKRREHGQDS
jgi:hypothetical protein